MKKVFLISIGIVLTISSLQAQTEARSNDLVLSYKQAIYTGGRAQLLDIEKQRGGVLLRQPTDERIAVVSEMKNGEIDAVAIYVQEPDSTWLQAWKAAYISDVRYDVLTLNQEGTPMVLTIQLLGIPKRGVRVEYFPIKVYKFQKHWF